LVYSKIKGIGFVTRELFSKKLLAKDADEARLDAIFRILKAYSSPLSYELMRPIISRIVEIASNRPGWFVQNLLSRADWKEILRLIVRGDIEYFSGMRGGLQDILCDIEDSGQKKKLMDSFSEIGDEEQRDSEKLTEFIRDPSKGLDVIRGIYDLCHAMGPMHANSSFDILVSWITKEPDKKKLDVLFYLMSHCDGAYHREILNDIAVRILLRHQPLFVSAMETTANWRWIIYIISGTLYEEDKEFRSILETLGNTEIEKKIKAQLKFLRDHISY